MTSTLMQTPSKKRVILYPVSWETYQDLLADLGESYPQRLAYSEGYLEIVSPLPEHESNNRFIDDLIRVIADELNINLKKFGSLTLRKDNLKKGVEPDSSYYIQSEPKVRYQQTINLNIDPPPDLVLEVDITSDSLNKLPIYAAFSVPEIWRYKEEKIEVLILVGETYQTSVNSIALPWLDLNKIPQLIQQSLRDGETATLKSFRAWIRQQDIKGN